MAESTQQWKHLQAFLQLSESLGQILRQACRRSGSDRPPAGGQLGNALGQRLGTGIGLQGPTQTLRERRANRGPRALSHEAALRLGTNIAAYVLGIKPLQDRLAQPTLAPDEADDRVPPRNTITIALLVHGGHWNPRPSMPRNLARALSQRTAARTAIEARGIEPTDPKLYDHPVVHMTGTRKFAWTAEQAAALRQYLLAGGFLFADACAGERAFDAAFRAAMSQVFPDRKLALLPASHPLYRAGNTIDKVAYLPPVQREFPGLDRPRIEGIEIDGRLAVAYSPLDIGCALEDYPCPYCRGYAPESARQLAVNLLVYGTSF